MALDRQTIERRDFPIGRRGYEPEAVDAHLERIAEEVDALRRRAAGSGGSGRGASPASIAQAASEQVRAIVEAAESSAADIERAAQEEADRIRDEAQADALQTREDAIGKSQEHVGRVRDATGQMLQRVDAMESELTALVDALRTGANRLTADLSLLVSGMTDLYDASGRSGPSPAPVIESMPAARPSVDDVDRELDADDGDGFVPDDPGALAPAAGSDVEGARLVALNMALNGTPREETDRYLAENFDLSDRAALLDEVYATVEG
jgi:DivIVA domain-containing protein